MEIPEASRPYIPGYGLPTSRKDLLDWSHVAERAASATEFWVTTPDEANRPRTRTFRGRFDGERLRLFDVPAKGDAAVAVFVGNGSDALIFEGVLDPDNDGSILNPHVVFAWTDFTKNMTRWRFED